MELLIYEYFKDTFLNKTLYSFEVKDEKGYFV